MAAISLHSYVGPVVVAALFNALLVTKLYILRALIAYCVVPELGWCA